MENNADVIAANHPARFLSARTEAELGWPIRRGSASKQNERGKRGITRPYMTVGYRWDGGDGYGASVFEYGFGIAVQMANFTLDSSFRAEVGASEQDIERASYSLSFSYDTGSYDIGSYDTGNDGQGLILALRHDVDAAGMALFPAPFSAPLSAPLSVGASTLVLLRFVREF